MIKLAAFKSMSLLYRGDASSTILILGVASVLTVLVYLLNRRQLGAYPE